MERLLYQLVPFAAAFVAGAINSVAGGGTLLTFPTLVWLGLPPVTANATNTVLIWPGSLGGAWGYRRELDTLDRRLFVLLIPSVAGGVGGALILGLTPPALFERLVPFLILLATCLFLIQEPIQRLVNPRGVSKLSTGLPVTWVAAAMGFQLLVGLYGGYFGAGAGILMLAALGMLGLGDIHQMNGLKNLMAVSMNGAAAVYFVVNGMVYWPHVLIMATGAIAGGIGGAGIARRIGQRAVRRLVVGIGFGVAALLFFR